MNWNRAPVVASLHHRKEEWLRHQKKFRAASEMDAAGVVFLLFFIGKPLRLRNQRMLRNISQSLSHLSLR
jgi:hypothetical protein